MHAFFLRAVLITALVMTAPLHAAKPKKEVKLEDAVEKYVANMRKSFNQIPDTRVIRKTQLTKTNRYFMRLLKKHSAFTKIIRTNSRGRMINEVIRDETPRRVNKNVSRQKWYSFVRRKKEDYSKLLYDKRTGRYSLFWAKPIMLKSKGKKRFAGAVAAKIDLGDTFFWFSKRTREPFLIRLDKMILYSNRWEMAENFVEHDFEVPGVKKISIRYIKKEPPPEPVAEKPESVSAVAAAKKDKPGDKAKTRTRTKTKGKGKAKTKTKDAPKDEADAKAREMALGKSGPSILPFILILVLALGVVGIIVYLSVQKRKRMQAIIDEIEKP
jgi:hypothetical protein